MVLHLLIKHHNQCRIRKTSRGKPHQMLEFFDQYRRFSLNPHGSLHCLIGFNTFFLRTFMAEAWPLGGYGWHVSTAGRASWGGDFPALKTSQWRWLPSGNQSNTAGKSENPAFTGCFLFFFCLKGLHFPCHVWLLEGMPTALLGVTVTIIHNADTYLPTSAIW